MKFFTKIVPIILTCKKCSDNYKNHIKQLKIDLSSREALVFWLYKIHNRTNKNLNKEEYPFEKFNDKLKNYNYFKRTASNSTTTYIVYMQKHLKCDNLKLKIAFSKFVSFIFSQCAFLILLITFDEITFDEAYLYHLCKTKNLWVHK